MFAAGLETYPELDTVLRQAIERDNALRLFPRLGAAAPPEQPSLPDRLRHLASRQVMRTVARMISTT